VAQRLRIAGNNGHQIFDSKAIVAIHDYAGGIPRVINTLCEHALVNAFVDQQSLILPAVVDAVAQDFGLLEGGATFQPEAAPVATEKLDLTGALRALATVAERLRQLQEDLPKEG